jgi:hypothetical protein
MTGPTEPESEPATLGNSPEGSPAITPATTEPVKPVKTKKPPKPPKVINEVVFHTYPKFIFVWPIIAVGLIFWPIVEHWQASAEVVGWVYLLIVTTVLLTLGIDLERDHAVFWLVTFLAIFFAGKYLDHQFGERFTLLGNLYRVLADMDVRYDPALGRALSFLLLPPYLAMLVWARLQHRWRITHNEFEHYSWGRSDDSLARGAKRVRSTFPDLLELLICGAGTLVVYSATGRSELRRIPHVPLIFLVRRRINILLEATAVTPARQDELFEEEATSERDEELENERDHGIGGNEPL